MNKKKWCCALDSLLELEKYGTDLSRLEFQVQYLCDQASQFNHKEVHELLQKKREYENRKSGQSKAARDIQVFIKKYPTESSIAAAKAFSKLKEQFPEISIKPDNIDIARFLEKLITEFSIEVKRSKPILPRQIGPLLMPQAPTTKQKNFPDLAVTGLLFHLVCLFRDWTATGKVHIHGAGYKMRTHGKPCYRQAALFVNAVFDMDLTPRQAQDRLKLPRGTRGLSFP